MATASIADASLSCLKDVRPPITGFTPSMWDHFFTSFSWDNEVQEQYVEAIEALKPEAKSMLMAKGNSTADKLVLIDTLERLGVAYHFEQEIEEQLQEIFKFQLVDDPDYDLFSTSLQFRLLRQHRHLVSCDVFDKFKREDNKFIENLTGDAKGLLSLYEAAHLRIHGEDILDEAVVFTTHHLNRLVKQLGSPLQDKVNRALEQPLHRGLPRVEIRHFISFYEQDGLKNELLLKLAKLDFNYVQNMYKKELCELFRWWNELELKSKLPYARDRVMEAYLWGLGFHFEPQYSYARVAVANYTHLGAVIDDTYDNYATLEEAELFTDILGRWAVDEIDRLPEYMKIVYKLILSLCNDTEPDAVKQGKSFAVPYLKETVKMLAKAYNGELKWFIEKVAPTFEEYFANTLITSCIHMMFTSTIPGFEIRLQRNSGLADE